MSDTLSSQYWYFQSSVLLRCRKQCNKTTNKTKRLIAVLNNDVAKEIKIREKSRINYISNSSAVSTALS
jgi:hypothetical protein